MDSKQMKGDFQPSHCRGVPFGVRPPPPLTDFEMEFFAYIRGIKESTARPAGVREDEEYPVGVADALTSEGVTVLKQVCTTVGGGGGAAAGDEDERWNALVKFDAEIVDEYADEDASVPDDWEERDTSRLLESLGLEAQSTTGGSGVPMVVQSVSAGSVCERWGVTPGMEIVAMTAIKSITIAMMTLFRRIPPLPPPGGGEVAQGGGEVAQGGGQAAQGGEEVEKDEADVAQGGRDAAKSGRDDAQGGGAVTQGGGEVTQGGGEVAKGTDPSSFPVQNVGGMVLADERYGGTMAKMLMCMFFETNKTFLKTASDWSKIPRPSTRSELRASQAQKQLFREMLFTELGFDVKLKKLRGLSSLLQVDSIVEGYFADLHGLRVGDTLLSVNGHFLVDVTRDWFVAKVAEGLKAFASGKSSDQVLRFVIFRKKAPQSTIVPESNAPPTPPKDNMAKDASSSEDDEPAARAPAWDEPSPNDAVVPVPAGVKAAAAKSAARKRRQRAEVRARPDWWGPREKGAAVFVMKLRPAHSASSRLDTGEPEERGRVQPIRGVEESKGGETEPRREPQGEPVPPGAFLREELRIGDEHIPAGSQLLSVASRSCRDMTFQEVRALALTAGKKDTLIFSDG